MNFDTSPDCAAALDRDDELRDLRQRFHLPRGQQRTEQLYFCGNSLGLQPKKVAQLMSQELKDWAEHGVRGHQNAQRPWVPYHEFLTAGSAQVMGARPLEVVNMNSLTVNLHLMMVSFYRPTAQRHCILIEQGAFPSDRYAVTSQIHFHGFSPQDSLLEIAPREGEDCVRHEDIEALLEREGNHIALVMLPGVQYRTGQVFDMARITEAAHKHGCLVGFDLAHAAGNLQLSLHEWGPDFAAWCSYKYLNGGPGALAGCFVHERHAQAAELPRFAGWWGHHKARRFLMEPQFDLIPGAEGWQLSNPPILAATPLIASYELFLEAGMERLCAKSGRLTAYLQFLLDETLTGKVSVVTPREPGQRGCQLSLRLHGGAERAKAVFKALSDADVTCDWREPDIIRVAPVPLYNSFQDVRSFVDVLAANT